MTWTTNGLPGFRVERRTLLTLPAAAALGALARREDPRAETRLAFAAFAEECKALADRHLAAGAVAPDAYLHQLAALGARLSAGSVPRPELADFGGFDPPVGIRPVHRALPLMVIQWRLDPGAVLPPHNHTPGHVFSLCLEGECWVRHFELAGEAPAPGAPGSFRIRQTHARRLRPGLGSSLTYERDNIHTFEAGPEGALGIDVNTFLPGEGDWSMLACEPSGADDYEKLFDARWIGKP